MISLKKVLMRKLFSFIAFWFGFGVIILHHSTSSALCAANIDNNAILFSNVRKAMAKTMESQTQISKAYEACDLWDDINFQNLPKKVRATAFALQAACLVRVGRDQDALVVYDSCLALRNELESNSIEDVKFGRAAALQRCMAYSEAMKQYLECSTKEGILGAVTCCLRLQKLDEAIGILENRHHKNDDCILLDMMILLRLLKHEATTEKNCDDIIHLKNNASKRSPVSNWICSILDNNVEKTTTPFQYSLLEIAAINQSPFDDPLLIDLDDKILLHELLRKQQKNNGFCPKGFVLPKEEEDLKTHIEQCCEKEDSSFWILKSRYGYGSHGNQLITTEEILKLLRKSPHSSTREEAKLCQALVHPPLLIEKRKFSIRVYVYYFIGGDIYLSKLGLVKLASEIYEEGKDSSCVDNNNDRMHMTNSGREESMLQYDFTYLRKKFDELDLSYVDFWNRIESAVKITMQSYQKHTEKANNQSSYRSQLARFGIPKILGFDFTMTEDSQPMLLEVNRFPGLEPRNEYDSSVKKAVVRDAWICAAERAGITNTLVKLSEDENTSYYKITKH